MYLTLSHLRLTAHLFHFAYRCFHKYCTSHISICTIAAFKLQRIVLYFFNNNEGCTEYGRRMTLSQFQKKKKKKLQPPYPSFVALHYKIHCVNFPSASVPTNSTQWFMLLVRHWSRTALLASVRNRSRSRSTGRLSAHVYSSWCVGPTASFQEPNSIVIPLAAIRGVSTYLISCKWVGNALLVVTCMYSTVQQVR